MLYDGILSAKEEKERQKQQERERRKGQSVPRVLGLMTGRL